MNGILLKRIVLAIGVATGLSLWGGATVAQDCTTKVGAVLPTSVDWGRPIAETAQFVVDQVNEAGGVAGCQIELILRDTQVDPKVGVDAAKALVDLDGVEVLIGAVSSGVSIPILTSVTVPAPTVRPPSRIAKRRPLSMAIGVISSTSIVTLSPGITISTPSGN